MAGGDNVLGQSGMGQIECAVRIGKDPGSFGRCDLEGGVAEPFDQNRSGTSDGHPQKSTLYDFQIMAKAEEAGRKGQQ
jgi:hypothetical protein